MTSPGLPMPSSNPADVERFRSAVAKAIGLAFDDDKLSWLEGVLGGRLAATGLAAEEYLVRLEAARLPKEVFALAEQLTVGETYFFRNRDQHRALLESVLPSRLACRAAERRIALLSAGCASGEEPYSLAILLREAGVDVSWDVSIRAVDANPAALARARRGRYSEWSFRETSPERRERWFRSEGRLAALDDSIRESVRFEERNLATEDDELWRSEAYDVILCRNVVMYFAPSRAAEVLRRAARALAPGGFLFLGHAESLHGATAALELCHTHGTLYYRRTDAPWDARSFRPGSGAATPPEAADEAAPVPEGRWVDVIGDAAARIRALASSSPTPPEGSAAPSRPHWDLAPALGLLAEERFVEAREIVDALPPESALDPDVLLLRAVLLMHSGETVTAEEACARLLEVDQLSVGARYVLALCREARGDAPSATEHDRIAIHLEPGFSLPHLHLGLLSRHAGDLATARQELAQALGLLAVEDPSRILLFGGGFSREVLVVLCRTELARCGGRP